MTCMLPNHSSHLQSQLSQFLNVALSFMAATSARRYRQDRRAIASLRQINAWHSRRDSCCPSRVTSHESRLTSGDNSDTADSLVSPQQFSSCPPPSPSPPFP